MKKTVKSAEALVKLMYKLNDAGEFPTIAFADAQGIVGVAYGIDQGDTMGVAYLTDPGEDRGRGGPHDEPGDESYIGYFEGDILLDLQGPIRVLYVSPKAAERIGRPKTSGSHSCESCEACLHNGAKCCGCYDGACCQESSDSGSA